MVDRLTGDLGKRCGIFVGVENDDDDVAKFSCSSSDTRPRFVLNRFDERVTSVAGVTLPKGDVNKMSILGSADDDDVGVAVDTTAGIGGGVFGISAYIDVGVGVDVFAGVLSFRSRR